MDNKNKFNMSNHGKITLVGCQEYKEDSFICDSSHEPTGQCINCGAKWFEHLLSTLTGHERDSARDLQIERGFELNKVFK